MWAVETGGMHLRMGYMCAIDPDSILTSVVGGNFRKNRRKMQKREKDTFNIFLTSNFLGVFLSFLKAKQGPRSSWISLVDTAAAQERKSVSLRQFHVSAFDP